ncbi:hypothetical protein V9T40_005188 [Parthenolecanium corni]|uniref:Uncharacterized protein n=1 Tax=Parthenolecanium corni TaxID=536013 RepID=A0AAN9TDQ4_9HEMI
MYSTHCNFESTSRIPAPYPYFNAVIYDKMETSGIPIPEALPETPRGQWTPAIEAALDTLPDVLPIRTKVSDFFAETNYIKSLQNKCANLQLPWKCGFSRTNRHFWAETLKYAVREWLVEERAKTDRLVDEEGVDRFVHLVESAIFYYVARDPAEYGNSMAAKYDAIRGGDFPKEERILLQHFAWL